MTLLTATSTLIDHARSSGAYELDPELRRAVKRMEQRLEILQRRASKALQNRQHLAFWEAWDLHAGKISESESREAYLRCKACAKVINWEQFHLNADYTGRGKFIRLKCPFCEYVMGEALVS